MQFRRMHPRVSPSRITNRRYVFSQPSAPRLRIYLATHRCVSVSVISQETFPRHTLPNHEFTLNSTCTTSPIIGFQIVSPRFDSLEIIKKFDEHDATDRDHLFSVVWEIFKIFFLNRFSFV